MDDDDRLAAELAAAERLADPVPAHLVTAAIGGYHLRTMDAELAELVFDSATDAAAQLVRGAATRQLLSFRAGDVTIELEIVRSADSLHLVGQLLPPRATPIDIRTPGASSTVSSDRLGRFTATISPVFPFHLRLPSPGEGDRPIATAWVAVAR